MDWDTYNNIRRTLVYFYAYSIFTSLDDDDERGIEKKKKRNAGGWFGSERRKEKNLFDNYYPFK